MTVPLWAPIRTGLNGSRMTAMAGALLLAVSACSSTPDGAVADEATTASVADCEAGGSPSAFAGLPDLELPCLGAGPAVQLRELTGRPTLINMWATWCGPCREEMPLLAEAFREHGDVVRFLGVDSKDDADSAADFLAATGVTYPQAVDGDGRLMSELGLPGLPVTLAVDPTGQVITTQIGQMTQETLEEIIGQLTASASLTPAN